MRSLLLVALILVGLAGPLAAVPALEEEFDAREPLLWPERVYAEDAAGLSASDTAPGRLEQESRYRACLALFQAGAYGTCEKELARLLAIPELSRRLAFRGQSLAARCREKQDDISGALAGFRQVLDEYVDYRRNAIYQDIHRRHLYYSEGGHLYEYDLVIELIRCWRKYRWVQAKVKEYADKPAFYQLFSWYYKVRLPKLQAEFALRSRALEGSVLEEMRRGEYRRMTAFLVWIERQEALSATAFLPVVLAMERLAMRQYLQAQDDGLPLDPFKQRHRRLEESADRLKGLLAGL